MSAGDRIVEFSAICFTLCVGAYEWWRTRRARRAAEDAYHFSPPVPAPAPAEVPAPMPPWDGVSTAEAETATKPRDRFADRERLHETHPGTGTALLPKPRAAVPPDGRFRLSPEDEDLFQWGVRNTALMAKLGNSREAFTLPIVKARVRQLRAIYKGLP